MRERLIELIGAKICEDYSPTCNEWQPHSCEKCYANNCRIGDLADYLLENGVVVLPFKVGDKVYRATQLVNGESFIQEGIVFEIASTYENGKSKTRFYFWAKGDEWESRHYSLWCDLTEFGKTVFLSREEAERALKGDEGK